MALFFGKVKHKFEKSKEHRLQTAIERGIYYEKKISDFITGSRNDADSAYRMRCKYSFYFTENNKCGRERNESHTGADKSTGDTGFRDKGTGNESTGDAGTGNKSAGNESTGDTGAGDKSTGNTGTGYRSTADAGAGKQLSIQYTERTGETASFFCLH